jgi:hypothetical protein
LDNCCSPFGSLGTRLGYLLYGWRIHSSANRIGHHRRSDPVSAGPKGGLDYQGGLHSPPASRPTAMIRKGEKCYV